jgi:protein transport protein SEC24
MNQNANSVQQTQNSFNNSYLPNQQGPPINNMNTSTNNNYQLNSNYNNLTRGPPPPQTTGPPTQPTLSNMSGPPLGPNLSNYNMPPPTSQPPMFNGPPTSANPVNASMNKGPPVQSSMPPTSSQPLSNQFNKMSLNSQPQPPQFQQQQQPLVQQQLQQPPSNLNRNQPQAIDLLREKKLILPYSDESDQPVRPIFPHEFYTQVNCHADTIRCTLTSIPETQSLLSKLRLPLGILIHPFKDLESLKVVQSSTIVRCRSCRSYINPFVHFLDNSKWRCNMCYSINDLPDEFLFDPVTRSYGDPSKRPEINSSTIEFIAPPEYTVRTKKK